MYHVFNLRFLNVRPLCVMFLAALFSMGAFSSVEAVKKKMDKGLQKQMQGFIRDREAAFSGEKAKTRPEAEENWTGIMALLDKLYSGEKVKLSTFGTGATSRHVLTHMVFIGFQAQQKRHELAPPPEKVVAQHPFLQELVVKGTCYTRGETYPKKMKDLLSARPGALALLRLYLDSWDEKYRKQFETVYPIDTE